MIGSIVRRLGVDTTFARARIFKFLGLYPNINWYQLYYDSPNSFMPFKVYEFKELLRDINISENDVVLDFGCGEGSLTMILARLCKVAIGIDRSQKGIQNANGKAILTASDLHVEFHNNTIEEAEFESGLFDKVFSFSVIEHIPNYLQVFKELHRILKDEGQLVISVDSLQGVDDYHTQLHQRRFSVQRYFNKSELGTILTEVGFSKVAVYPIFKSEFSKDWFIRVMKNPQERFSRTKSFATYFRLTFQERLARNKGAGMFLVAKCQK
jgi:ubiquinone/menaquinone biosynthesis C-methylase UbiE